MQGRIAQLVARLTTGLVVTGSNLESWIRFSECFNDNKQMIVIIPHGSRRYHQFAIQDRYKSYESRYKMYESRYKSYEPRVTNQDTNPRSGDTGDTRTQ